MEKKLFNAELRFYVVIQLAKRMLEDGKITGKEYAMIERKMRQKYAPFLTNATKESTASLVHLLSENGLI